MQFKTIIIALFAGAAVAVPTGGGSGGGGGGGGSGGGAYDACSGLYDSLQCCATDVLGLANLDCAPPTKVPTSAADFKATCATGGQRARCCVLPVVSSRSHRPLPKNSPWRQQSLTKVFISTLIAWAGCPLPGAPWRYLLSIPRCCRFVTEARGQTLPLAG
ncbi:hypothetical protein RB594_003426 [Gaeumannomyces avenae]